MIQVERPDEKLDMEKIVELLSPAGVQLDTSYGPINVNPKLGRYVVRGTATPRARRAAEKIEGVQFFGDAIRVEPTGKPGGRAGGAR